MVVLGSPDKESLGKVYEENPDIFYEVPVVNIDNHAENDNFGQLNIVDITSSSTSEIVADMLQNAGGGNFVIFPVAIVLGNHRGHHVAIIGGSEISSSHVLLPPRLARRYTGWHAAPEPFAGQAAGRLRGGSCPYLRDKSVRQYAHGLWHAHRSIP